MVKKPSGSKSEDAKTKPMPVIFIGHGSPENALGENAFARGWKDIARTFPKPKAILSVSAHWVTDGTYVTGMEKPRTIHDFYGFQRELYDMEYPARGSPELAGEVIETVEPAEVGLDTGWGLDHGTWIVLTQMYPKADIPVVQLSLDGGASAREHYRLASSLNSLRRDGVLVLGSGNIVHNLGMLEPDAEPFSWALEFGDRVRELISRGEYGKLCDYSSLKDSRVAVPTNEHYLPLLYTLGAAEKGDMATFYNDKVFAGSVSMSCVVMSQE